MTKYPEIPHHLLAGAKSRKDLASEYSISESTLYRRLKAEGIELPRRLLLPKDYIIVYQTLGPPSVPPPPKKNRRKYAIVPPGKPVDRR